MYGRPTESGVIVIVYVSIISDVVKKRWARPLPENNRVARSVLRELFGETKGATAPHNAW
jgi:hypothetical protein